MLLNIFKISLIFTVLASLEAKARFPFKTWKTDDKTYQLSEEKLNWYGAYESCRVHGFKLVSFDRNDEQNELSKYLYANTSRDLYWWVDYADLAEEGQFVSLATPNKLKYCNWVAAGPDNFKGNENCVMIRHYDDEGKYSYLANDWVCTNYANYICEGENTFEPRN